MAHEVTGSRELALVLEAQFAIATWANDRRVEINKVRVVCRRTLGAAYTVRIVADIAGCILAANVLVVFRKALIVQNAILTVAFVT